MAGITKTVTQMSPAELSMHNVIAGAESPTQSLVVGGESPTTRGGATAPPTASSRIRDLFGGGDQTARASFRYSLLHLGSLISIMLLIFATVLACRDLSNALTMEHDQVQRKLLRPDLFFGYVEESSKSERSKSVCGRPSLVGFSLT
jgi:hypothetical protein